MQLWSSVLSNNAAKVRIVLAEKGLAYAVNELPWTKAAQFGDKPAEFLAVSPRGQVPVLIDGDLVIHDSTVINEYLEEAYPDTPLFPTGVAARVACRLWEDEGDAQQVHFGALIEEVFLAAPGAAPSARAERAYAALDTFMGRLEQQLGDRDWICDDFSVADISVFMTLALSRTLGLAIRPGAVARWLDRVASRPSVAAEMAAMMRAVAAA